MADENATEEAQENLITREDIAAFGDINLDVSVLLGKTFMPIEQFLKLGRGAIIELERTKDEFVDIMVNDKFLVKGEITIVDLNVGVIVQTKEGGGGDDDMAAMMEGGDDEMAAMMEGGDEDMEAAMEGGE